MGQTKKTDNAYLADKVRLRIDHLPACDPLRVLDCFAGKGVVWAAVQKLTGRNILRLPIDTRNDDIGFHLPGDNKVYLSSLDLTRFDVIDLDAYGVPAEQIDIVMRSGFRGVLFVTFIQSVMGMMPITVLEQIGFTHEMVGAAPTLFSKNGWNYFLEYLAKKGVRTIYHRSHARKHYMALNCAGVRAADCDSPQAETAASHA